MRVCSWVFWTKETSGEWRDPLGSLQLTWQQLTGPGQVRLGPVVAKPLLHIKTPIELKQPKDQGGQTQLAQQIVWKDNETLTAWSGSNSIHLTESSGLFKFDNLPWDSHSSVLEEYDSGNGETHSWPEFLLQLDVLKSMKPNGIHPTVLKELNDIIAGSLSIFCFSFILGIWRGPCCLEAGKYFLNFKKAKNKDLGNYRPVSITSVPLKLWKRLFWELIKNVWETHSHRS